MQIQNRKVVLAFFLFASCLPNLYAETTIDKLEKNDFIFIEQFSGAGVSVWSRMLASDISPDYIQIVDLSKGAKVVPLLGNIERLDVGLGFWGADKPTINLRPFETEWEEFYSQNSNAVCMSNGQFFGSKNGLADLSYPVKINNLQFDGFENTRNLGEWLVLNLYQGYAEIKDFEMDASILSDNAMVGLSERATEGTRPYEATGRTYIGLVDKNSDARFETLVIFNTAKELQADAATTIRTATGAQQIIMFDGGGSTQLICDDESLVYSTRPVPQMIGVLSGGDDDSSISPGLPPLNFRAKTQ
jgi:hypothetical protein